MKKITKSLSSVALCTLLYVPISSINATLSNVAKPNHLTTNKTAVFLPPPLPCGFTSKATVSYPTTSYFFTTEAQRGTQAPILANTGTWTRPPYLPQTIPNQVVVGSNKLILQSDGNLVMYYGSTALWATGTNGTGAQYLYFHSDGNLVLARDVAATDVVWASNIYSTCSGSEYAEYIFQGDGNLVMIYPVTPGSPTTQWYQLGDTGSGGESVSTHFGQIY